MEEQDSNQGLDVQKWEAHRKRRESDCWEISKDLEPAFINYFLPYLERAHKRGYLRRLEDENKARQI